MQLAQPAQEGVHTVKAACEQRLGLEPYAPSPATQSTSGPPASNSPPDHQVHFAEPCGLSRRIMT